jgi:hypothetical protein
MSDLQNQTPANTYKGLLQVDDYTNGVNSTAKFVSDGKGANSALSISESKVGVGTVSPSAELDVNGNVVADEYALDGTGSSSSAVAIHAPAPNELAIRTNSTEAMRIDSDGRVGINTTDPDSALDVADTEAPTIHLTEKTNGYSSRIGIPSAAGQVFSSNATPGSLAIRNEVKIQLGGTTPFVTIDGVNGNCGINTTSPDSLLDVNGVASFRVPTGGKTVISWGIGDTTSENQPALVLKTNEGNNEDRVKLNSDGDSWFYGGNLGIGTDSPSAPLEVASTTGGVIMPRMNESQRDAISSPTNGEMIYNTSTNKFQGRANGAWVDLH